MSGYADDYASRDRRGDRGGDRGSERGAGRNRDQKDERGGARGGSRRGDDWDEWETEKPRDGGRRRGDERRERSPRRREGSRSASPAPRRGGGSGGGGRRQAQKEDDRNASEEAPARGKRGGKREDDEDASPAPAKKGDDKEERRGGDNAKKATPVKADKAEEKVNDSKAKDPSLTVGDCKDKTISAIIKGTYTPFSANHGKTVYRKDEKSKGIDVFIYFWDERDGDDLCGWWFSPAVGGDEVWAYHPSRNHATPPPSDWNVPHDGEIDPTFRVSNRKAEKAEEPKAEKAEAPRDRDRDRKEKAPEKESERAVADPYGPPPVEDRKPRRSKADDPDSPPARRDGDRERRSERDAPARTSRDEAPREEKAARKESPPPVRRRRDVSEEAPAPAKEEAPPQPERSERSRRDRSPPKEDSGKKSDEKAGDKDKRSSFASRYEQKLQEQMKRREEDRRRTEPEKKRREEPAEAPPAPKAKSPSPAPKAKSPSPAPAKEAPPPQPESDDEPAPKEKEPAPKEKEPQAKKDDKSEESDVAPPAKKPRGEDDRREDDRDDRRRDDDRREDDGDDRRRDDRRRGDDRRGDERRGDDRRGGGDRGGDRRGDRGGRDGDRRERGQDDRRRRGRGDSMDNGPQRRRDDDRDRRDGGRGGRQDDDRGDKRRDDGRGGGRGAPEDDRRGGRGGEDDRRGGRGGEDDRRGGEDRRPRDDERRRDEDQSQSKPAPEPQEEQPTAAEKAQKEERQKEEREKEEQQRKEDERQRDEDRRRKEKEDEERRRADERRREDDRKDNDEDRKKREEMRKAKEEEMKRKDEALQEKRAAKRREEDEKRKAADEERRIANAEKRKIEMANRSEAQKKADAERAAAEEAQRKQKEEEAMAVKQQSATLSVLQVLQKLSSASPENFDVLKKELDEVLATELQHCGAQEEILKAEAQRVVEYAQQYVGQVLEQRNADAKAKTEAAEALAKSEATARDLLAQLEKLVSTAEEASENVHSTAAPLLAPSHELNDDEVMRVAATVHKQGRAAMAACSFCADFITTKRPIIQEADSMSAESTQLIAALLPRIKGATRRTAEAFQKGKEHRTSVCKRTAAKRVTGKNEAMFKKYDSDNDGLLTIQDLAAYAKGEFDFEIPEENLKRIVSQLFPFGHTGLGVEAFKTLKTAVGIARTEVRGKTRKDERESKQAFVDSRKSDLGKQIADAMQALDKDEAAVKEAEQAAEKLASEAGTLQAGELKERADTVEGLTSGVKEQIAAHRQKGLDIFKEVTTSPELEKEMRAQLGALDARLVATEGRIQKAGEMAASGRQLALYMGVSEYEGLWTEVVVKLRSLIEADNKTVEELFSHIAGVAKDDETVQSVSTEAIYEYMKKHETDIDREKVDKLFLRHQTLAPKKEGEGDGKKTDEGKKADEEDKADKKEKDGEPPKAAEEEEEDDFIATKDLEAMTVAALKALCKQQDVSNTGKKAELVERLAEKYGAAKKEKEMKKAGDAAAAKLLQTEAEQEEAKKKAADEMAARLKETSGGKTVDKEEFNRIVRMYYKVARQCVLSDNLLIEKSAQVRRMEVGEILEVQKGPCIDTSVGVYRLLAKAVKDGTMGWATIAGNQGITFLMPGGRIFTVKATTAFTVELKDLDGSASGLVRPLKEGEFLEVMEWARTSQSALGVTRIQARAQTDGAVGWATVTGNDGTVHLEAM